MKITEAPLKGVLIIKPTVHNDNRGFFLESFQQQRYQEYGMPKFVQDNTSHSKKDVLRGLHYQKPNEQGKLVYVSRGDVFDAVVDLRQSSPTFGQWFGLHLNDVNHLQLYIPPGFAHGFCVLSDGAEFHYKCTEYYTPNTEHGIAWNDPSIGIAWPISHPILSKKDSTYPYLNEIKPDVLFA